MNAVFQENMNSYHYIVRMQDSLMTFLDFAYHNLEKIIEKQSVVVYKYTHSNLLFLRF